MSSPTISDRTSPRAESVQFGSDERGVTLLEILVVIVILGLLATLGSIQLFGYLNRARSKTASLQIEEIQTAISLFQIDISRVPTTDEGLKSLVEHPEGLAGWAGPYLRKQSAIVDPWGRPFVYRQPGTSSDYDVISYGADGKPGGDGADQDISSAN